jgi:hypothetical protein
MAAVAAADITVYIKVEQVAVQVAALLVTQSQVA